MVKQIAYYIVLISLAYWVFRWVFGKEYLGEAASDIKWGDLGLNFASTVGTFALFYFPPRLMIDYGFRQSLVVGALALAVWIAIMIQIIMAQQEDNRNQTTDLTDIVNFSVASLMLAVNICSGLSYALVRTGIASYTKANDIDYGRFMHFYLWHFIDIVPIVRVWKLLNVEPPMTIGNFWAGLPVLMFDLFVILVIIKSLKKWFATRDNQ